MNVFKCLKCGKELSGFIPSKCECGFTPPVLDGIYQFTTDEPIAITGDGLKWLGYENVGVNYEPALALGIDNMGNSMYIGNCSRKLKEYLGDDSIVLDLGAGLGQASVPLAAAGVNTIALDISQKMLTVAKQRADKINAGNNLICVRMNAYKLEIVDRSIDAVVEIDMLHQVDHPELVISEVKRVLKPNGVYVKYRCRPINVSVEQQRINDEYNKILKDITSYYDSIAEIRQEDIRPFSSWDRVNNCMTDDLTSVQFIDTGIVSEWRTNMRFGLHKLKTRASGAMQLIPEEIHKKAWDKTDIYARKRYGEDYNNIERYDTKMGFLEIYKVNNHEL